MPQRAERNAPLLTEQEVIDRLPIIQRGISEFNDGLFFQAHETLEEVWIVSPWPVRNFLQGIIQVAAAFVHLARNEYPGSHRLLEQAIDKLSGFPATYLGIDNARLIDDARRCLNAIRSGGDGGLERFDRSLIPKIRFDSQAASKLAPPAN